MINYSLSSVARLVVGRVVFPPAETWKICPAISLSKTAGLSEGTNILDPDKNAASDLGQHLCSGLFVPIIWVITVVYVYRCSCWDTKRGVRRSGNIISGITGLIVGFVMPLVARILKSANICQMIYRIQPIYHTYPSTRMGLIVDFVMSLVARIIKSANICQMIYRIQPIYRTYPSKRNSIVLRL